MNILYTDTKRISLRQSWQVDHDIVVSANQMNRRITPSVDKIFFDIMLGAKYNNRPFDYFRDMLTDYVKRW